MRYLFIITLLLTTYSLQAQSANIIADLNSINKEVANTSCNAGKGKLISNRAYNLFIGYKVGTYLSNVNDLSFYKNNIIINTFDGTVAVNHNVFEAKGKDEPVKSVLFFGVKANAGDVFVKSILNKKISNEFGINVKQTWVGKSKTFFNKCISSNAASASHVPNPKVYMDGERSIILHRIESEIIKKSAEFDSALNKIDTSNGTVRQSSDATKQAVTMRFYNDLKDEYYRKFAGLQAEVLEETKSYNYTTINWTSINAYIPLATEKFTVSETLNSSVNEKHPYTFGLTISHTRFWESTKIGRIFLTLTGSVNWNNSKKSYALNKVSFNDYKNRGGTDTLHLVQLKEDEVYMGDYKSFITPTLSARLIYFPPDYHFGLSFLLEQNIGTYNLLNGALGIPIVLIDKKALPSVNLEFQFRFFDLSKKIKANNYFTPGNSLGLTAGIPLSKIIY
jgi:hypothetical protein